MKRVFGILLVLIAVMVCAAAAADVKIDPSHFPDDNFRAYMYIYDLNGNGTLEDIEISQAEILSCADSGISSIDGVQYLTALQRIDFHNNMVASADFSKNLQLINITCYSNQLTKLNISKNTNLIELGCSNNRLTSLSLPNSSGLCWLDITSNSIKTLDISHAPLLAEAVASVAPTDYLYWDGGYSINWIVPRADGDLYLAVDKNVTVISGGNPIVEPTPVTEFRYDGIAYSLNNKKKTAAVSGVTDPNAKSLTILDTVTVFDKTYKVVSVDDNALRGLKKLKTLTIGKKVKTIGKNAVASCVKLTTVKGGAGVVTVMDSAFSGCKVLKEFPDLKKLQSVGAGAFKGCAKLTKFTLGSAVKSIGQNAFIGCKALKTVIVKTTRLTAGNVGNGAFKNISKKAVFTCPASKLKAYKKLFVQKGAPKTCQFK